MSDWACRSCRSINAERFSRCYRCKAPKELVQLDPATDAFMKPAGEVPRAAGAPRDTRAIAVLAGVAIWAAVFFQALSLLWADDALASLANGSFGDAQLQRGLILVGGFYGAVLVALLLWATWVSLVIVNVPRLGAGWPSVTPGLAFFEHLIPIWNVWRAPSLVRILFRHLPGASGPDNDLIALWIGPLLAVVIMPRVVLWLGLFADADGRFGLAVVQSWLTVLALIVSAAAAVIILWRIEERQGLAAQQLVDGPAGSQHAT